MPGRNRAAAMANSEYPTFTLGKEEYGIDILKVKDAVIQGTVYALKTAFSSTKRERLARLQ